MPLPRKFWLMPGREFRKLRGKMPRNLCQGAYALVRVEHVSCLKMTLLSYEYWD